jgi:hypothetical protein
VITRLESRRLGLLRPLLLLVLPLALSACESDKSTGPTPPVPAVDQAFEPGTPNAIVGVGNTGAWGQTFTVGATGTLSSIDLILASQGPEDVIRVDVRGANGTPHADDGVLLGSRLIAASSLPAVPSQAFVTIDFASQSIPCVAGQTLAVVLIRVSGSGNADVLWITENQSGEDYAGGSGMQRVGGSGTSWAAITGDFYFRTRVSP